jgi:hypothetical protein
LGEHTSEDPPKDNILSKAVENLDNQEYTPYDTTGNPFSGEESSEEVPANNPFIGEIETFPSVGAKVRVGKDGPSAGVSFPVGFKYEENEDGSAKWQASVGLDKVQFDTGPIALSMEDTPEAKADFLD